jgi:hypothetical protein
MPTVASWQKFSGRPSSYDDPNAAVYFWSGVTSEPCIKGIPERTFKSMFKAFKVPHANAHRFRHTPMMGGIVRIYLHCCSEGC